MSLPVRCFSCNGIVGIYELKFLNFIKKSPENIQKFLDENDITTPCCARMFLGYVPWRLWTTEMPQEIQTGDKVKSN